MKLHVHEQGTGDRTALLVHGGMSDYRTWHAIADDLVARGYRVVAPDLRGHGHSARGEYTPELLGEDLVESLPTGADLAIGHSLGALALSYAVDRLAPARVVYSDPGFNLGSVSVAANGFLRRMVAEATPESIRTMNPRWSDADIVAEEAGFQLFDPEFFDSLAAFAPDYLPAAPTRPSLVQLADPSLTIDADTAAELARRGYEVRTVAGAGHCIHRDDPKGFLASLEGWI